MIGTSTKRPELQGLRAVAVLAVLIFHFNADWLPGGYLGVDAFFVLSGFLMAVILSRPEFQSVKDIRSFYKRRLKRVVPAAFFVAVLSIPLAFYILLPFEMRDYSASLVGIVTGTMNIMVANKIGYFTPLAEAQPLLHFWSLMVELHFYFLIPVVFLIFKVPKARLIAVSLLFLISLGYAQYRSLYAVNDAYYLLASRAWEFLAGVIAYLLMSSRILSYKRWYVDIGLIIVGLYFAFFNSSYQHPSISTLPFITGLMPLLIFGSQFKGTIKDVLASEPAVYLGNISFSFYLWHNLFIVGLSAFYPQTQLQDFLFVFLATLVFSHLTFTYIEQPFLANKISFKATKRPLALVITVLIACLLLVGLTGFKTKGFPDFWKSHSSEQSVKAYELYMLGQKYAKPLEEASCVKSISSLDALKKVDLDACEMQFGKGVLVIGDSHAIGVFRALLADLKDQKNAFLIGLNKGSCKVYSDRPDCFFNQLRMDASPITKNFKKVIYAQRDFDLSKSNVASDFLSNLANSSKVFWLGPRFEPALEAKEFVSSGCDAEFKFGSAKLSDLKNKNDQLKIQGINKPFSFVHAEQYDLAIYGDCSSLYWRDSNHWTQQGVEYSAIKLKSLISGN